MLSQKTSIIIVAAIAIIIACLFILTKNRAGRTCTVPVFDETTTPRSLIKKDTFYDGDSIYVLSTKLDSVYSMDKMKNAK